MTHKEIRNYDDLMSFIKYEIHKQINQKRKTAEIKLDSIWFFKTARFIQFVLKNEPEEHDARISISQTCTCYKVRINGYNTTFKRYDI